MLTVAGPHYLDFAGSIRWSFKKRAAPTYGDEYPDEMPSQPSAMMVGDKFLCVVVKVSADDAFVLTAYLTDKVKKGVQLWPRSE